MPRNRSNRGKRRGGFRPHRASSGRLSLPANQRQGSATTNLLALATVAGQPTKFDLTFDRPVTANGSVAPPTTDFQMAAGGQTTRWCIDWEQRASNVLRATMNIAPATAITFVGTIAAAASSVIPSPPAWNDRTASVMTL